MSNEELALAFTEIAIKSGIFNIPSNKTDLPYDVDGFNKKYIESCMTDIASIYRAALSVISKKQ